MLLPGYLLLLPTTHYPPQVGEEEAARLEHDKKDSDMLQLLVE